jgi:hypothetical protein
MYNEEINNVMRSYEEVLNNRKRYNFVLSYYYVKFHYFDFFLKHVFICKEYQFRTVKTFYDLPRAF